MHYKVTTPQHSGLPSSQPASQPLHNLLPVLYTVPGTQQHERVFLSDFQCEVMVLISAVTGAMIKMADSNSAAFMH